MRKGLFVVVCILIIAVLNGCGAKQGSVNNQNKQIEKQQVAVKPNESAADRSEIESNGADKAPPVIDHLDAYPFPVPSGWKEEEFQVQKYDDGMTWTAAFTFDGDAIEQALAYRKVIDDLGYETQRLMSEVFKIGTAEFAGVTYHGTFTFGVGSESNVWGVGKNYVEISFSEKK